MSPSTIPARTRRLLKEDALHSHLRLARKNLIQAATKADELGWVAVHKQSMAALVEIDEVTAALGE